MNDKELIIQKINDFKFFFVELNKDLKDKSAEDIFDLYFVIDKKPIKIKETGDIYFKNDFKYNPLYYNNFPTFFKKFLDDLAKDKSRI